MTALCCRDFSFAYAERPIVKDISFNLEAGEYLSVIGPNGSGKSTLLKCFLRLHDKGRATGMLQVCGEDIALLSQRALALRMAYVPQAGGHIPPFTVLEFLRLARYPHVMQASAPTVADNDAIERALALTGLAPHSGTSLPALSGGERQRAFLAAALAQGTDILLLDEPASFLDPRHVAELDALLRHLNRDQGMTIVTVTHDLNHPLCMGGKVLALRDGVQLWFGDASALASQQVLERLFAHGFTHLTHPATGRPLVVADALERLP